MRIIGGHDYYDSGMAWGQDDSVLFVRTGDRCLHDHEMHSLLHLPRIVCSGRLADPDTNAARDATMADIRIGRGHAFHDVRMGRLHYRPEVGTVILCGVLHHGLLITESAPHAWPSQAEEKRWIWNADALRAYAAEKGLAVIDGRNGTTTTWALVGASNVQVDVTVLSIDDWFAPRPLQGACRDAILDQRITVISNDPGSPGPNGKAPHCNARASYDWKVDQPTLGAMGFAKAIDPYHAFQEISMWKGGVLPADGPRTVEITDDKVKIAKHGFHHPTSFRKPKQDAK